MLLGLIWLLDWQVLGMNFGMGEISIFLEFSVSGTWCVWILFVKVIASSPNPTAFPENKGRFTKHVKSCMRQTCFADSLQCSGRNAWELCGTVGPLKMGNIIECFSSLSEFDKWVTSVWWGAWFIDHSNVAKFHLTNFKTEIDFYMRILFRSFWTNVVLRV